MSLTLILASIVLIFTPLIFALYDDITSDVLRTIPAREHATIQTVSTRQKSSTSLPANPARTKARASGEDKNMVSPKESLAPEKMGGSEAEEKADTADRQEAHGITPPRATIGMDTMQDGDRLTSPSISPFSIPRPSILGDVIDTVIKPTSKDRAPHTACSPYPAKQQPLKQSLSHSSFYSNNLISTLLQFLKVALAYLLLLTFLFAFAILIAHLLAWFLVVKMESRVIEMRNGVLRSGEMRMCLCAR